MGVLVAMTWLLILFGGFLFWVDLAQKGKSVPREEALRAIRELPRSAGWEEIYKEIEIARMDFNKKSNG